MIVTPRGLTIYLPRDFSFALMARLYPKVDAFKVLETAQGIYRIHGAAAFITGIVCFVLNLTPVQIAVWTLLVTFVFYLLRLFGLFIIPGMVFTATMYSRLTGYFLLTVILVVVGLIRVGLVGTVAFFVSRLVVEGVTILIDRIAGASIGRSMGVETFIAKGGALYFAPAADFVRAYKLYASRFNLPTHTEVSQDELLEENWIHVWEDMASKWPQVVQRFSEE